MARTGSQQKERRVRTTVELGGKTAPVSSADRGMRRSIRASVPPFCVTIATNGPETVASWAVALPVERRERGQRRRAATSRGLVRSKRPRAGGGPADFEGLSAEMRRAEGVRKALVQHKRRKSLPSGGQEARTRQRDREGRRDVDGGGVTTFYVTKRAGRKPGSRGWTTRGGRRPMLPAGAEKTEGVRYDRDD